MLLTGLLAVLLQRQTVNDVRFDHYLAALTVRTLPVIVGMLIYLCVDLLVNSSARRGPFDCHDHRQCGFWSI